MTRHIAVAHHVCAGARSRRREQARYQRCGRRDESQLQSTAMKRHVGAANGPSRCVHLARHRGVTTGTSRLGSGSPGRGPVGLTMSALRPSKSPPLRCPGQVHAPASTGGAAIDQRDAGNQPQGRHPGLQRASARPGTPQIHTSYVSREPTAPLSSSVPARLLRRGSSSSAFAKPGHPGQRAGCLSDAPAAADLPYASSPFPPALAEKPFSIQVPGDRDSPRQASDEPRNLRRFRAATPACRAPSAAPARAA